MTTEQATQPASAQPANDQRGGDFKKHPVDVGLLVWVLAPLCAIGGTISSVTWAKVERIQEQVTEVRVGQAKIESAILRQNELIRELLQEVRSR